MRAGVEITDTKASDMSAPCKLDVITFGFRRGDTRDEAFPNE
jgi:hypothetical protein